MLIPRAQRDLAFEAAREAVAAIRLGDPLDPASTMGPLVSPAQFDKVQAPAMPALKQFLEEVPGMRLRHLGDFFRCAKGDDLATFGAALRAEVHQPVSGLDHVQVVLDYHHGVAMVT